MAIECILLYVIFGVSYSSKAAEELSKAYTIQRQRRYEYHAVPLFQTITVKTRPVESIILETISPR